MDTTMSPIPQTEVKTKHKKSGNTPKKNQAKKKKTAQKKKWKQQRVRLALTANGSTTYLRKDPDRKHRLVPSSPEDIARQVSPKSRKNKRSESGHRLDEIELGKREGEKARKRLQKARHKQRRKAFRVLCSIPSISPDAKTIWKLLLLCLLSLVLDLAVPNLPGVPVIQLENAAYIPEPLRKILTAFRGPATLGNRGAKLKRPSYLHAYVPLGSPSPSTQMEDYLGGCVKVGGKKKFYWVPLSCTMFAIAPNTPESVRKTAIANSPLAIPILCGNPKIQDRPLLKLEGIAFQQYDPQMLKTLESYSKLIFAELFDFSRRMHQKKRRWRNFTEAANQFIPKSKNGRFISVDLSPETTITATALAVFKMLLEYAVKEKWVGQERARRALQDAQTQLLPQSAPHRDSSDSVGSAASWDDPNIFWAFLQNYLQEHQQQISLAGAPCDRNTIAVAHQVKNEKFLILPRNQCATAYADYLHQQGITIPEEMKKWETDLQRAILEWGVQIKREGSSVTWRFNFYRKDNSKEDCKVPCLAFPPAQLPDSITDKLTDWFGSEFAQWIPPQSGRNEVDVEKVTESSVNNCNE